MAIVNIHVENRIARVDAGIELVCNNPTDTINFIFDEEWAAYPSKIATFAWNGGYEDVAFIGNQVQTPEIFNTNYIFVGVYADGIATTPAKVNCKRSILCIRGNKRSVPVQADFTEFMKAAEEIATYNERLSATENDIDKVEKDIDALEKAIDGLETGIDALEKGIDGLENYEKRPFELTGNPIQMQNFEGMPLKVVTAFAPKQEGSGTPYPAGYGKNLIPFGDGDWTFPTSGTYSSSYITIPTVLPSNEQLKASIMFTDGTTHTIGGAVLALRDSAFNILKVVGFTSGETMTLTKEETEQIKMWNLYFNEEGVSPNAGKTVAWVQLERGATATEYAPYENIRPIRGCDALNLTHCGKNLLSGQFMDNTALGISGDTQVVSYFYEGRIAMMNIPLAPGTYTLSGGDAPCMYVHDENLVPDFRITNNFGVQTPYTFKITEAALFSIHCTVSEWDTVQLEYGSSATVYEAPNVKNYSAQIDQKLYGGRMDWTKGELTLNYYKIVWDGVTEGFKIDLTDPGHTDYAYIHQWNMPYPIKKYGKLYVNKLHGHQGIVISISMPESLSGCVPEDAPYVVADKYNAVLKAWYDAGEPLETVYEMNEPITIQLTPNDISALDGINTIYGDGEITVSGRKDILWLTSSLIERINALEKAVASLGGSQ